MTVDEHAFRRVMGHFATGVTVVTWASEPYHGLTANAVSSVSLNPPLVLVCVDHGTQSFKYLDDEAVDAFAINILTRTQRPLAEHFADIDQLGVDPFGPDRIRTEDTGAPIFVDSLAFLDCTIDSRVVAGDHTIVIGEVQAAGVNQEDEAPLTFYSGSWGTIDID